MVAPPALGAVPILRPRESTRPNVGRKIYLARPCEIQGDLSVLRKGCRVPLDHLTTGNP